jgi:hypothetical protein
MTVCGKPGKRWCYFPPFPQTLEIDETDSHIPTATTMTRMNQISSKPGPLRDTHSEGKVKPILAKEALISTRLFSPLKLWGSLGMPNAASSAGQD